MSKKNILGLNELINKNNTRLNVNLKEIENEIMRDSESSSIPPEKKEKDEQSEILEHIRRESKRQAREYGVQQPNEDEITSILESTYTKKPGGEGGRGGGGVVATKSRASVYNDDVDPFDSLSNIKFTAADNKKGGGGRGRESSSDEETDSSAEDSDDESSQTSASSARTTSTRDKKKKKKKHEESSDSDDSDSSSEGSESEKSKRSERSERPRNTNYHQLKAEGGEKKKSKSRSHSDIVEKLYKEDESEQFDKDDHLHMLVDKIDEMKDYLQEMGYDISRIDNVDYNSDYDLVHRVYKRCNRILHKRRYSNMFMQICLAGGTVLENVFDGERVFFAKYRWNMKGARSTIQTRMRQMEYETSVIMARVIDHYGLGEGTVVAMDVIPALLTLPYQNAKKEEAQKEKQIDKSEYSSALNELEALRKGNKS